MGRDARLNQTRAAKLRDVAFVAQWTKRHPMLFKTLMHRTTIEPWAETQAWMAQIDAERPVRWVEYRGADGFLRVEAFEPHESVSERQNPVAA
jgi:hypothetical protein